jgi:conjugal transfer pilus assembly protein TraA
MNNSIALQNVAPQTGLINTLKGFRPSTLLRKYGLTATLAAVAVGTSVAGTGSTDTTFDSIYNTIKAWAEGSLGKTLAVAAFLIGMGIGLVKQSAMAVVLGVAFALILAYGPTVIEAIFSFAV